MYIVSVSTMYKLPIVKVLFSLLLALALALLAHDYSHCLRMWSRRLQREHYVYETLQRDKMADNYLK